MFTQLSRLILPIKGLLFCLLFCLLLMACGLSPSQNFFGSFFPSWMYCIAFGIVAALLVNRLFVALKIDAYLRPRILVYMAIALCFIFASWLLFFAN